MAKNIVELGSALFKHADLIRKYDIPALITALAVIDSPANSTCTSCVERARYTRLATLFIHEPNKALHAELDPLVGYVYQAPYIPAPRPVPAPCLDCVEDRLAEASNVLADIEHLAQNRIKLNGLMMVAARESTAFPTLKDAVENARQALMRSGIPPDWAALSLALSELRAQQQLTTTETK